MEPIKSLKITRLADSKRFSETIKLPVESLYTLYLNDTEILTFMATPEKIEELAAGFLRSAGVVEERSQINKILVKEDDGIIWVEINATAEILKKLLNRRFLTSGCGGGSMLEDPLNALSLKPVRSDVKITAKETADIMKQLLNEANFYRQSGGLHGATICLPGEIFYIAEDIGRHNAVDKVLGAALLDDLSTTDKILATTGRISSEMLIKAAKAAVPIVLSRTSPTELAVRLAEKLNITIAGYISHHSMNIYSHDRRIDSSIAET